jgi:glycosyltransferase involved in cell wall biosynthesis
MSAVCTEDQTGPSVSPNDSPGALREESPQMPRLSILVNTIAPYRLPLYAGLAKEFETVVLHGGVEPNRNWSFRSGSSFQSRQVWTLQVPRRKRTGTDGICDISYVHLNLGLLWELPRSRPDVVVSNELGLRTVMALLYSRITRTPLWVWWGGTLHSERYICTARRALRWCLTRSVDHWISYGATSTEYLQSLGVAREDILQIQNCVEQERFLTAPKTPGDWFPDDTWPVLLYVGQLIERKGVSKLIEACGRLHQRGQKFTLVMIGAGCEYERLQELGDKLQLEHFHILPEQPQAILNQLYRRATALVFPTLEDVWGLVVNEALWADCPVLCSVYAGCAPEIVPDSNTFDPMCDQSFDAALGRVFDGTLTPASASLAALRTHQQVTADLATSLRTGVPAL